MQSHRFTLYEQRTLRTRRNNRRITIGLSTVAAVVCFIVLYVTRWP